MNPIKMEGTQIEFINHTDQSWVKHYMLFDLKSGGHHPNYIRFLIEHLSRNSLDIKLDIVVATTFLQKHQDVINLVDKHCLKKVRFISISEQETDSLYPQKSPLSRLIRNIQEWRLLCRYAKLLNVDHCLVMFLDTCELPLILGLRPPCLTSGIYFRPTFHYKSFSGDQVLSKKDWLRSVRERFFLSRTLKNPRIHRLFCIDPFVSQQINYLYKTEKATTLVDPVEVKSVSHAELSELRKRLGIEPNRKVFLLFGSIDGRKGIYKLMEALSTIPFHISKQVCLLIVGEIKQEDQNSVQTKLESLQKSQPLQVITVSEFIADQDVHSYFHLSDVVMALYQQHVGMSGILLLAAAAQKPVFSSDYGLMGELVRCYHLGLAVDSTQVEKIHEGFIKLLTSPLEEIGNPNQMKRFAEQNHFERFAESIFQNID
jgi:glycosyltransferase involved in cell wall biosynthesis